MSDETPKPTASVPLPPDFVAMYPSAPTRQVTPVTDFQDAINFHRSAAGPYYQCMAQGEAQRAAAAKK